MMMTWHARGGGISRPPRAAGRGGGAEGAAEGADLEVAALDEEAVPQRGGLRRGRLRAPAPRLLPGLGRRRARAGGGGGGGGAQEAGGRRRGAGGEQRLGPADEGPRGHCGRRSRWVAEQRGNLNADVSSSSVFWLRLSCVSSSRREERLLAED